MTAHSGLLLFGEFALGQGVERCFEQEMPKPGSDHACSAFSHGFPLLLMLAGGAEAASARALNENPCFWYCWRCSQDYSGDVNLPAFRGGSDVRLVGESPCSDAFSRVHARTALRWRLDDRPRPSRSARVSSRPRWGADDTRLSRVTGRPLCGTARAYTPSLRRLFRRLQYTAWPPGDYSPSLCSPGS